MRRLVCYVLTLAASNVYAGDKILWTKAGSEPHRDQVKWVELLQDCLSEMTDANACSEVVTKACLVKLTLSQCAYQETVTWQMLGQRTLDKLATSLSSERAALLQQSQFAWSDYAVKHCRYTAETMDYREGMGDYIPASIRSRDFSYCLKSETIKRIRNLNAQ